MGRLREAEVCLRDALDKRRRVLGGDHRDTLDSLNNLAVVLQTENKLKEAEACYREAVDKFRRTVGSEHKYTLDAVGNLGSLLQREHRANDAEPYVREAYETRRRTLGEEHPATLSAEASLGVFLQNTGKFDEAERYQRDACEKSRRVLGDDHPGTLTAIANLGATLVFTGKANEAIQLLAPSESAARKAFVGDNLWRCGWLLVRLGSAYSHVGEFAKAESYLLEGHAMFVKSRGESHDITRVVVEIVVDFYERWNAAEPGKGYDSSLDEWKTKLATIQAKGNEEGSGR
jgi:tetratricopeptide (TPR) repeat protein